MKYFCCSFLNLFFLFFSVKINKQNLKVNKKLWVILFGFKLSSKKNYVFLFVNSILPFLTEKVLVGYPPCEELFINNFCNYSNISISILFFRSYMMLIRALWEKVLDVLRWDVSGWGSKGLKPSPPSNKLVWETPPLCFYTFSHSFSPCHV